MRARRSTLCAAAVWAALAICAPPAVPAADLDFGARAGAYLDEADPMVGLELLTRLGSSDWFFNPNVEFVFADSRDRFSLNADFHYDFFEQRQYYVWAGAGLAGIWTESAGPQDSETDLGANLLGGIGWKLSGMTPYAQLKIVLADDSEVAAAVGIRF